MDQGMISIMVAIAGAAAAYFLVQYVLTRATYKKVAKSRIQLAYMAIEEAEQSAEVSLRERLAGRLALAGWYGGFAPILTSVGFLYAISVVGMYVVGFNQVLGAIVGVPACAALVSLVVMRITSRRRIMFQRQLMPALGMLASQIEAGNGAERALEQILPSLEDPLGAELEAALASTITVELVPALAQIGARYPSRAFTLFLAALEVDRLQGGSLAPALREASAMLQRQFELAEEAQAEVAQAKMEFYIVAGIVAMIAAAMLTSDDDVIRGAYTSPSGIVAVGIGFLLALWGIYRALRVLRLAKEGGS